MDIRLNTPLTREDTAKLTAGDYVYLSGTIYTARDAAHARMSETLDKGESLPVDWKNNIVYYLGPTLQDRAKLSVLLAQQLQVVWINMLQDFWIWA